MSSANQNSQVPEEIIEWAVELREAAEKLLGYVEGDEEELRKHYRRTKKEEEMEEHSLEELQDAAEKTDEVKNKLDKVEAYGITYLRILNEEIKEKVGANLTDSKFLEPEYEGDLVIDIEKEEERRIVLDNFSYLFVDNVGVPLSDLVECAQEIDREIKEAAREAEKVIEGAEEDVEALEHIVDMDGKKFRMKTNKLRRMHEALSDTAQASGVRSLIELSEEIGELLSRIVGEEEEIEQEADEETEEMEQELRGLSQETEEAIGEINELNQVLGDYEYLIELLNRGFEGDLQIVQGSDISGRIGGDTGQLLQDVESASSTLEQSIRLIEDALDNVETLAKLDEKSVEDLQSELEDIGSPS
ncbi:MAG: hypothetical protein ABEJ03_00045 [Candidatus Nanohaloarchaea archaeon]